MSATLETPAHVTTQSSSRPDFGTGRYSACMAELYGDLMRLCELSSPKAEKIARQYGSDFGKAVKDSPVTARVGRSTQDGKMNLAEATKAVKATTTHALLAARLCTVANALGKEGAKMVRFDLPEQILEWVND